MALTEEQLKSDLEGYLRKLAGVMPVGHYWFGIDPKSKPAGVQLYSGQLLFRRAYQKHWEFVSGGHRTVLSEKEWQAMVDEQGFCPYFSYGDGSTTYRMPLVRGVHPKFVASLSEAGQYKEAGAPNIRASAGGVQGRNPTASGSFSVTVGTVASWSGNTSGLATYDFDASLSSPVYRDDIDTIQPPALTHLIGEYVVGSVATLGEADAESLLASVTTLESNVGALQSGVGRASAYIVETWHEGTEWYRRWSDGWIEQGGFVDPASTVVNVNLYTPFTSIDYTVLSIYVHATGGGGGGYNSAPYLITPRTTTAFSLSIDNAAKNLFWRACGY